MKPFINKIVSNFIPKVVMISLLTFISFNGLAKKFKVDKNTYFELEGAVNAVLASPVADSAPLEMKFIKEKLTLAKQAKADRDRKLEAQYTEQIYADIEIAKLRAELNQLNDVLLNKRDQVSEAQLYLKELQDRLK
ncbi:MAG: DUF4398 domain-containing protein [Marinicella sp.]|nr:DUF4398 domain-containing protein [Xanthomonadales bacterium]